MSTPALLRERHKGCDCLVEITGNGVITKHQCRLTVTGLQVAVDCDECRAFGENAKKPDLIILQQFDSRNDSRWLIVEIKGVMKLDARDQTAAGLQAILKHDMFNIGVQKARVCFAFRQRDLRQTADRDLLRRPFKLRGETVPVLVVRCGRTIPQRWQ